jgi:hypothetical protein
MHMADAYREYLISLSVDSSRTVYTVQVGLFKRVRPLIARTCKHSGGRSCLADIDDILNQ